MHYNVLIIHIQSALKHETELIIMHQKNDCYNYENFDTLHFCKSTNTQPSKSF